MERPLDSPATVVLVGLTSDAFDSRDPSGNEAAGNPPPAMRSSLVEIPVPANPAEEFALRDAMQSCDGVIIDCTQQSPAVHYALAFAELERLPLVTIGLRHHPTFVRGTTVHLRADAPLSAALAALNSLLPNDDQPGPGELTPRDSEDGPGVDELFEMII